MIEKDKVGDIRWNGYRSRAVIAWQTINLTGGTATLNLTLLGTEQVTVNGKTYLTAKVQMSLKMSGTGTMSYQGTHSASFSLSCSQTVWSAPTVGIVKLAVQASGQGKLQGFGSGSWNGQATLSLL